MGGLDEDADGQYAGEMLDPACKPLLRHTALAATIKPSQPIPEQRPPAPPAAEPDVVSLCIGDFGRWQLMTTFLLAMFSFPCTFHIYLPTFTAKAQEHWCRKPQFLSELPLESWINYSQPNGPCTVRILPENISVESILNKTAPMLDSFQACTAWDFDRSDVGDTIISEWNLVCDRAGLTNIADVVFLVGVGIGGVIGGFISDKFGRKRTLMGMAAVQSTLAIMSLFVRSFLQYMLVRLVMGFVSVSVVYAAFVLTVEVVGGKWVTIAGVCNFFPLPVAYIIVSLLSLALPNWRDLQLTLSLPGVALLVLWFVLPESPRWLLITGRNQEAKAILQKAANFNKRELPADLDKLMMVYKENNTKGEENPGVMMLFRDKMWKKTFCLFFIWFAMTIAYYGLLLNIGNFNLGKIHTSSVILALVEVPAIAVSIPILLKAGRRMPVFITMLACGVACVATEILSISFNSEWVMIGSLMVGKFAISSTNMMLPIYTAEIYPTVVRNLGTGCSQLSAGLALIFVPYLWELSVFSEHLPLSTIAFICVVGGLAVLLLPETAAPTPHKHSPQTKKPTMEISPVACNGTFVITDDRGR